jgi:hypothetical protein
MPPLELSEPLGQIKQALARFHTIFPDAIDPYPVTLQHIFNG